MKYLDCTAMSFCNYSAWFYADNQFEWDEHGEADGSGYQSRWEVSGPTYLSH